MPPINLTPAATCVAGETTQGLGVIEHDMGGWTVRLTGTTSGELEAPAAVMVMVPLYGVVEADSPAGFTDTVSVPLSRRPRANCRR